MDACLTQPADDDMDRACAGSRQSESPNPFLALVDTALARICVARAEALGRLDWATESERVALRAGTALLLDAVARRLGEPAGGPVVAGSGQRFRLGDLLDEAAHDPFLAIYERSQQQAEGQEPFSPKE